MTSSLITIRKVSAEILEIALNRPEKRNALNIELMKQLCDAFDEASKTSFLRAIIICGEGTVFCAGLDLKETQDLSKAEESSTMVARLLKTIHTSPLFTVAAVHGAALAGGAGLMSACDFVVAAKNTQIGYPEVRHGLIAAQVMPFLLHQAKQRDVKELLLLGEPIEAERALAMGLVNRVVEESCLKKEAYSYAILALQGAPKAIAETKRLIHKLGSTNLLGKLEEAKSSHCEMRTSEEAQEGIAAFLEKRKPFWIKD